MGHLPASKAREGFADTINRVAGEDDLYRIWGGNYRIIYTTQDKVVKIGDRKEVYRS